MTVHFQAFHSIKALGESQVLLNWSGTNPLARLEQVFRPHSEHELQQLLQQEPGRRLRLIGSSLSYEPIHSVYQDPAALLVDLCHLTGRVACDGQSVTYRAGTQVDTLYADLVAMGRMLPASPGVIGIQTLGGALSTGTHGQGLGQSSLCEAVLGLRVMLASGEVIGLERDDPRFGAFVMGLGCLGILLEVRLATVPNRIMRCTKFTTDYAWLREHNERVNREHAFVKSWWFAWTGECHLWVVDPASQEETARYHANGDAVLELSAERDERMNATIERTLSKMARDTKDEQQAGEHFETVRRFKDASDLVGNVYQILCKGIPAPQINCEVAVPLERMNEALALLEQWQQANPGVLHYPFILRCCGPSTAWLSPAHGRAVCWIGFLVYLAADGSFVGGSLEQMRELQRLLAPLGGLPHFGKHLATDLYDFPRQLPRWHDFLALRRALDPHGRFLNRWTRDLFQLGEETP